METLYKQVRRARRRLILRALAGKLAWCWFATLFLATIAIAVGKLWPLVDERIWTLASLGAALVVGLLAAMLWTWLGRQSALEAAIEIDRRFGLKERVSSSLALQRDQLTSEIGQALVRDAGSRLGRIDLAQKFRIRPDRRALLPLVPAAIALALAVFVGARTVENPAAAATAAQAQATKSTRTLVKKLDALRKEAAEKDLTEADGLLKQLEEGMKNLPEKNLADRKQTLIAINDLVKNAEKRRQQLTSGADLKQQLGGLKNLERGPADRMGQALKNGNLAKAIEELDKLKQKLAGDKLDPQAKEALAKQLDALQQALERKVQAHEQAQQELREQIEAQRRSGNTAAADKLQQQLDKLADKMPQMEKFSKMQSQLKQASKSLKNGDTQKAADSLAELSDQLSGMEQELKEMDMLDSALADVADCKNALVCKECNGEGCAACQGQGDKPGDRWMRNDMAHRGGGIGAGNRPEAKTDTNLYDSQVKPQVSKGAAVVAGLADGPNRKGQVEEEIKSQFATAPQQTAEALSGQRLPHDYRDHAKKYFDALREGQK